MKFVILKFLIVMLVKFVYELIKLLYLNKIFLFLGEFLILILYLYFLVNGDL